MSTAATMPLSIFRDESANNNHNAIQLPTFNFTATSPSTSTTACSNNSGSSPYRPSISSPLSSSPIRASSSSTMTTPPLSPRDPNAGWGRTSSFRDCQSSPIRESKQQTSTIFGSGGYGFGGEGDGGNSSCHGSKFSSRPTRPVPLNLKRDAAQESRRKLFLKNVRQRAEDRRWEMRGGEQELLKLEWFSLNRELRSAKNADFDGLVLDSDIEEAARLREEVMRKPLALGSSETMSAHNGRGGDYDADAMMVDMLEQQQQAELEAMMASVPEYAAPSSSSTSMSTTRPPDSPHHSDDDAEYDALFTDFINSREAQHGQDQDAEMDLS